MVKLAKQYYRTSDGNKKVNGYHIRISKKALEEAELNENDNFELKVEKGKIIIQKGEFNEKLY